jgi:hypothetical protein
MRKIFFILAGIALSTSLFSQEPADALRYSWYTSSGTARQQAVGGAMTSLGGDLSAAYVNPAGLGFYKTGDFVLTPGFNFLNNKSTYYGRTEKDSRNSLSFGVSGVVIGGEDNNRKNKKSSSAFALAINRTASFSSNLLYRGANTQNSYSQKFLEEISSQNDKDANSVAQNYPFGTSLAFNTYWIDTVNGGSPGNYQFQSRATIGNLLQENKVVNRGGITELALAFAGNLQDKVLFGATVGIPFLHYEKEATFTEADATANTANKFDFASITDNLTTSGAGINLKLGMIYKPVEYVRLGLAVHTPTFYNLTDKYSTTVTANTEMYKGLLTQESRIFTNNNDAEFKYWMFSPWRVMASASYVLREIQDVRKQKGFLTADIEYVNYRSASFTTDPDGDNSSDTKSYLKSLNKTIDNTYKGAFNVKAGGELKFTTIMGRLGVAYYGNPYKDLGHNEKGGRFQLTGGLGYRNKGIFVDLAYVHTMGKDIHFAYRLQHTAYTGAAVKSTNGNAVLTVGFKI